jgi:hypothetical protein
MTAYDLAPIFGWMVGGASGVATVRYVRKSRRAEPPDPQCANVDAAGHRCILMTGHAADHQVLPMCRRPDSPE